MSKRSEQIARAVGLINEGLAILKGLSDSDAPPVVHIGQSGIIDASHNSMRQEADADTARLEALATMRRLKEEGMIVGGSAEPEPSFIEDIKGDNPEEDDLIG